MGVLTGKGGRQTRILRPPEEKALLTLAEALPGPQANKAWIMSWGRAAGN